MEKNLRTRENITSKHKDVVIDIITRYWDYFCLRGVRRDILGYVFCVNTGSSPPVSRLRPIYGPHEKPIMLELITTIKDND